MIKKLKNGAIDFKSLSSFNQIDLIKGVAILFIIVLHAFPRSIYLENRVFIALSFQQAVPLFVISTGYVSANSWFLKKLDFKKYFSASRAKNLLYRILRPFLLVVALQVIYLVAIKNQPISSLILSFITDGGWGAGSYYPWLYLQLWVLLPFLLWFSEFRISENSKLIMVFILSLSFEIFAVLLHIPEWLYRLVFVRYFFALYIGIFWYKNKSIKPNVFFFGILSALYITFDVSVGNLLFPLTYPAWSGQHAPAYFYSLIMGLLIWNFYKVFSGRVSKIICYLGKASWHIFLFQMVFFLGLFDKINTYFDIQSVSLKIFSALYLCVLGGIAFFKLESNLDKLTKG